MQLLAVYENVKNCRYRIDQFLEVYEYQLRSALDASAEVKRLYGTINWFTYLLGITQWRIDRAEKNFTFYSQQSAFTKGLILETEVEFNRWIDYLNALYYEGADKKLDLLKVFGKDE